MSKRSLTSVFAFLFLIVIVIDGLPVFGSWHQELKNRLDPLVDATGLWQGSWQLFAPEVDKVNVAVSARIIFADGTEKIDRTPDWQKLSIWKRFLKFREMEYVDNIRRDENAGAWEALADFLKQKAEISAPFGLKVKKVILIRHWAIIPKPENNSFIPFGAQIPFTGSYQFYQKEY